MVTQPHDDKPPKRSINLILACCGWGSGREAAETGPQLLLRAGLAKMLDADTVVIEPRSPMSAGPLSPEQRESSIMEVAHRVAAEVGKAVTNGHFPVVIGGDHTSAIGFHTGLGSVHGQTGIIWIDTHPDLNTPQTSPSGNIHGMVLAGLLGRGSRAMLQETDRCLTTDELVAMVGIRSIDPGEQRWLDEGKINCMLMEEVSRRGLKACLADAVGTVNRARAGFGLTIDLDAIDPSDAPFVATPVGGGIGAKELALELALMPNTERILGMEVTEFTPKKEEDAQPACALITSLVRAVANTSRG